ncbi:MAG: sulfotransferase family protein [Blastocatellia bacterium]|nr:sulfotransferase family protein [Blastocatellia bacterium]
MRDFVYISVPKTATNSIHAALDSFSSPTVREGFRKWKHLPAREIRPRVEDWESRFKFGFVRNTFDMLVSWFFYQKQDRTQREYDRFDSFESWVKSGCPEHWTSRGGPSPFLQCEFFMEDDSVIVDFIGRYENLNEDFDHVCRRVGVRPPPLPELNKSNHNNYRAYYDEEMIGIVSALFARDLEMFDYRF